MIDFLFKYNPYKYNYQIARMLLATAQILTLIFSNYNLSSIKEAHILGKLITISTYNLNHLKWIPIIILIWVVSGYFYKLSSVLHFIASFILFQLGIFVEGGEQICVIVSFLLMIICFGDRRKCLWDKETKYTNSKILYFLSKSAFCVIKIQVAIIYLFAATIKIRSEYWVDGSAMYYWFNNAMFGANPFFRYILDPIFNNHILSPLITWSVLILEFLLFAALFMDKKQQRNMYIAGFTFHFGIILIMGLWSFGIIMIACLTLYLEPDLKYFRELFCKIKLKKINFKNSNI